MSLTADSSAIQRTVRSDGSGTSVSGYFLSSQRVSRVLIAIAVFLGAFVIDEPAPYEIFLVCLIPVFLLLGLRLSKVSILLAAILVVFNVGGLLAMFTMDALKDIPLYLTVSLFLALTSVFWCAYIEADMGRLRLIFRAYIAGALVTAILGIIGYFKIIPGAEAFTKYERASGYFQDPNVFGPFLILLILYLGYGLLYRNKTVSLLRLGAIGILLLGLFLSFSRGAWGSFLLSAIVMYLSLLATETSVQSRARLLLAGVMSVLAIALMLAVSLQFDAIANMFETRAQIVQEYDAGRLGRFERHIIGFQWALENPLGIGAKEFGLRLVEDEHNIWVKALMAYGWLGFLAWLTMTVITMVAGFRLIRHDRPWRPYLICAWSVFVGHTVLAWVIDIDHWRHFYLIVGIIWGCMALEIQHQRATFAPVRTPDQRPAH